MFKLIEKIVDAVKLIKDPYYGFDFDEETWDSDEDEDKDD